MEKISDELLQSYLENIKKEEKSPGIITDVRKVMSAYRVCLATWESYVNKCLIAHKNFCNSVRMNL